MADETNPLSRAWGNRLLEESLDDMFAIVDAIVADMVDGDGMVFGDIQLSPAERVMSMLQDARTGVLDVLADIAPSEYERRMRQHRRDIKALGLDGDRRRAAELLVE